MTPTSKKETKDNATSLRGWARDYSSALGTMTPVAKSQPLLEQVAERLQLEQKPLKVGSRTARPISSPWAVNDARTQAWPERYQGRYVDMEALLNAPVEPVVWRVDQLARDGYHTIISGPAGTHKTFFIQAIQDAVANGTSIGDMACRAGAGVHLDGELGTHGIKSRSHVSGYGRDLNYYDVRGLDLSRQDDVDWLTEIIAHHIDPVEGGLVTYDSLRALTPGASEDASDEMSRVVRAITNMARDTGAAILGIHHMGWQRGRLRGSSTILDQSDAVLNWLPATSEGKIAKTDEDDIGSERWLICKPGSPGQKFNVGPAPQSRAFHFDATTCRITGLDGVPGVQVSWDHKILSIVAAGKVTREARKAVAEALECSNSTPGFVAAWSEAIKQRSVVWDAAVKRYVLGEGVELPSEPIALPEI